MVIRFENTTIIYPFIKYPQEVHVYEWSIWVYVSSWLLTESGVQPYLPVESDVRWSRSRELWTKMIDAKARIAEILAIDWMKGI